MFEQKAEYPIAVAGDGDEGIEAAIEWSIQHIGEDETLTVWTHAKGNLEHSPALQQLANQYSDTAHMTGRGASFLKHRGPVLMAWPDMEDIGQIARSTNRITALCVIAWNREELAPWVATVKPTILGEGSEWEMITVRLDPTVEEALRAVTRSINHNNTISAGFEKDQVVSALLALRRAGYAPDPGDVQAWALAHGWTGKNPKRLADYVRDIDGGKTPRARNSLVPNYIEILQERIAEREANG